jgi:hypothetical protein
MDFRLLLRATKSPLTSTSAPIQSLRVRPLDVPGVWSSSIQILVWIEDTKSHRSLQVLLFSRHSSTTRLLQLASLKMPPPVDIFKQLESVLLTSASVLYPSVITSNNLEPSGRSTSVCPLLILTSQLNPPNRPLRSPSLHYHLMLYVPHVNQPSTTLHHDAHRPEQDSTYHTARQPTQVPVVCSTR